MTPVLGGGAVVGDGTHLSGDHLANSASAASEGLASALIISSACLARSGVGATDPSATRVVPSSHRITTADTTEMTMALRGPILANSC